MADAGKLPMWIQHVFDHPVGGADWYFEIDAPQWQGNGDDVPELIAATFERADELLAAFSDEQLERGFWYLLGEWPSMLVSERTPAMTRMRILRSFVPLFEKVMAVRCTPHLGHLSEQGGPMNLSCYMWWDLLDRDFTVSEWIQFRPEIVAVLQRILMIPHDGCRESVLHGIGHLICRYPNDRELLVTIVDGFVGRELALRPELASYAAAARKGCIL